MQPQDLVALTQHPEFEKIMKPRLLQVLGTIRIIELQRCNANPLQPIFNIQTQISLSARCSGATLCRLQCSSCWTECRWQKQEQIHRRHQRHPSAATRRDRWRWLKRLRGGTWSLELLSFCVQFNKHKLLFICRSWNALQSEGKFNHTQQLLKETVMNVRKRSEHRRRQAHKQTFVFTS
jgi:hypothetical protein